MLDRLAILVESAHNSLSEAKCTIRKTDITHGFTGTNNIEQDFFTVKAKDKVRLVRELVIE